MFVVKHRKIFYAVSGVLVALSILAVVFWGLKLSIDFTGGSSIEVTYAAGTRPSIDQINAELAPLAVSDMTAQPTGANDYIINSQTLTQTQNNAILSAISVATTTGATSTAAAVTNPQESQFDSVGPILGQEAVNESFAQIFFVIVAIVLFITFAFRKVSQPVSSWKYGLIAIVALIHDVMIPVGVFAILGHFLGIQVDTLFVTAILVILGFSIHDTIVVFDRVRENLRVNRNSKKPFEEIVGESINQTFARSINTSLTVLLALAVLYIFGADATRNFILALLVGIAAGTYSSIFIGSPLLVTVQKWQDRKNVVKAK